MQVKGYQFRVGHSWRVKDDENGYVVRVTPKKVLYVHDEYIFKRNPVVHHIKIDNPYEIFMLQSSTMFPNQFGLDYYCLVLNILSFL